MTVPAIRRSLWLVGSLVAVWACPDARDSPRGENRAPAAEVERTQAAIDSIAAEGQRLYDDGEFRAARETWLPAAEQARAIADTLRHARLLTSIGLAAWRLGEHERARALSRTALDLKRAARLHGLLPRSYNALGLIAWDQGRLGEASALLDSTIAIAEQVGDEEYVLKAGVNLGNVHMALGEFHAARRSLLSGLAAARELGHAWIEGRTLINLATLENRTGRPRAALDWLVQTLPLELAANDPTAEESYWAQLVYAHSLLGEARQALVALDGTGGQYHDRAGCRHRAVRRSGDDLGRPQGDWAREVQGEAGRRNRAGVGRPGPAEDDVRRCYRAQDSK